MNKKEKILQDLKKIRNELRQFSRHWNFGSNKKMKMIRIYSKIENIAELLKKEYNDDKKETL